MKMKFNKILAIFVAVIFLLAGCSDSVQRDSEFGYSLATPVGYNTTTPKDGFKMGFCPKENSEEIKISVKAVKIDDDLKKEAMETEDPDETLIKLLEKSMVNYCEGGNMVQNKGLTVQDEGTNEYKGCYISAAADDADTPRTDVYYIAANGNAYVFVAECKNNTAADKYRQDILDLIGSIQLGV